jgi:hypothetical protein
MRLTLFKYVALTILSVTPMQAFADWKKLECMHENGFVVYIDFDSTAQTVRAMENVVTPALITPQSIQFTLTFPDGKRWFHTINRSNGVLIVKLDSTDGVPIKHLCKPFKAVDRRF